MQSIYTQDQLDCLKDAGIDIPPSVKASSCPAIKPVSRGKVITNTKPTPQISAPVTDTSFHEAPETRAASSPAGKFPALIAVAIIIVIGLLLSIVQ